MIAGGGVGALEAALALKALAGDRVRMTLVSPDPELTFRPPAAFEAFGRPAAAGYDLQAIARDLGARLRLSRLEAVAPKARTVRLASGARLEYDALVLAIGARANAAIPGALTFRDRRDVPWLRRVMGELDAGALTRLAFAVPAGSSWTLPLYELALLSAERARRSCAGPEIVLVSPERTPLEIFGADGSRAVEDLLRDEDVRFIGRCAATEWREGMLVVRGDAPIKADRVITVPQLRVNRVSGIPASWWGFVPTDAFGRVEGLSDVYAAGDMTTDPIKQGGLATQQADRIAHTIAASLGAPVKGIRSRQVLRARLVSGRRTLLLRTELDWRGRPTSGSAGWAGEGGAGGEAGDGGEGGEIAGGKLFGRYLTPYLEARHRGMRIAA